MAVQMPTTMMRATPDAMRVMREENILSINANLADLVIPTEGVPDLLGCRIVVAFDHEDRTVEAGLDLLRSLFVSEGEIA